MKKAPHNNISGKDFESMLWEAFWSYPEELSLENTLEKQEKVRRANILIPELAATFAALDLYFDYPLVHIMLTSVHLDKNILHTEEFQRILSLEDGPDSNSRLAYIVSTLKKEGIAWQRDHNHQDCMNLEHDSPE